MLLEVSKFLFIAVFVLIWFFAQVQKVVVQGDQEAEEGTRQGCQVPEASQQMQVQDVPEKKRAIRSSCRACKPPQSAQSIQEKKKIALFRCCKGCRSRKEGLFVVTACMFSHVSFHRTLESPKLLSEMRQIKRLFLGVRPPMELFQVRLEKKEREKTF
jgi:hypothetical protein